MPKKPGDVQRTRPKSMGEIGRKFADSLENRDVRYQRFWDYEPVPKLMDYFASDKHVKAIFGANKSSKTTAGVFEAIMVYTGIIPPSMQGVYAFEDELKKLTSGPSKRPRHVRIIVQSHTKHFPETIEPLLISEDLGMLPEAWSNWNAERKMFTGPDGSWLSIISVNPHEKVDPSVLRGPLIDHCLIDEINQEMAYTESLARPVSLKDGPRSISMVYCPQEGLECWTFRTFFKACYDRPGNHAVRKKPEDCHPDIYSIQISMKDNPSISQAAYEAQKRLYRDWEVAFRVDGEYSNRTSNPFFNMETLEAWEAREAYSPGIPCQLIEVEVDTEEGVFEGHLVPVEDEALIQPGGELDERFTPIWRVWEAPQEDEYYVVVADIAEGNQDSDPHSMSVWKATDPVFPVKVATVHMVQYRPGNLGVQGACMANVYGNCLLVPEANNTGGGMFIDRVRNYENLYTRPAKEDEVVAMETEKLGWSTNRHSKGPMLDNAYKMLAVMAAARIPDGTDDDGEALFKNHCPFQDRPTILEFMSYEERLTRDKDGIAKTVWGARTGAHDDTVIDAAIALRIIKFEFDKLSPCRLAINRVTPKVDKHYLGEQAEKKPRAFSNMKKQPKMSELRRRYGANHARSRSSR